eukprot:6406870-Prymnesium_polylepis.2
MLEKRRASLSVIKVAQLTREDQLAAHLDRLPPESCGLVVTREESGRTAQRGGNTSAERIAAQPQQHHVEQGNTHGP